MKLGLGSYALAWAIGVPGYHPERPMDVFTFLREAADLGFECVQIADNLPLHQLTETELGDLEGLSRRLGVSVEVGTRGATSANLERYLSIAQRLGSPLVRVVVDTPEQRPTPDAVVRSCAAALPYFEAAGVCMALENHDRFSAATLRDIVLALDSPNVGVCLDTVNSFGALEGPEVVVETLGPFVINLHIKDFVVEREPHNMGFTIRGTPAGKGMLDIAKLVKQLWQMGRKFSGILELWPHPEASLTETINKEKRWVDESRTYLRDAVAGLNGSS